MEKLQSSDSLPESLCVRSRGSNGSAVKICTRFQNFSSKSFCPAIRFLKALLKVELKKTCVIFRSATFRAGISMAAAIYWLHTKGLLHAPQFNGERMSTGFYIGTLLIILSVLIHPLVARLMKDKEPDLEPAMPV